jgi:hypothetical protein
MLNRKLSSVYKRPVTPGFSFSPGGRLPRMLRGRPVDDGRAFDGLFRCLAVRSQEFLHEAGQGGAAL